MRKDHATHTRNRPLRKSSVLKVRIETEEYIYEEYLEA